MWAHQHCCGCNPKLECCDGGLVTNTNRRGLFGPSGQVCVYDPTMPITLTIGVTGNATYTTTAPGQPWSPEITTEVCSGSIVLESTDLNPDSSPVFSHLCSPKFSQHFVQFDTEFGNPDNLDLTSTYDPADLPPDVEVFEKIVTVKLLPFWNVAAGTDWLHFRMAGVAEFWLTGVGAPLIIGQAMGISHNPSNPASDISGTRSFSGSDPCNLSTSVSLTNTFSNSVGATTYTQNLSVTVDTAWQGLFRCNPIELASLHRAQRMEGRPGELLARVLGGGRMA